MTDIVWITLESVRQDHTSMGGHERETTPNLLELAEDGVAYDECYSHDIWTRASTASILTGRASSAHRVWSNEATLPPEITTVPAAFREAGYHTVGISDNSQFSPDTGLDAGFAEFYSLDRSSFTEPSNLRHLPGFVRLAGRNSGWSASDLRRNSTGYLANLIAKDRIAASRSEPLFLYLHHNSTHHSYVPPVNRRAVFGDDLPTPVDRAVSIADDMSDNLHERISMDEPFTEAEWAALRVMYDACIAYVDRLVGELVDCARANLDDPVIVVTSDHGELFGESGLLAHMLVAETAVSNVPLVVAGLDSLPAGGLIQPSDVTAVLCSELDVDHPVPVGRDVRDDPRRFAVTQRGGERARRKLTRITEFNPAFPADRFHRDDLTSVRTGAYRYQRSEGRAELYDLPDERTDVSDASPAVADRFEGYADDWLSEHGEAVGRPGTAEFSDRTEQNLRDMGYLQ